MNNDTEHDLTRHGIVLHEAVHELYTAIREAKHMVGERRSRPKTILCQLDGLEAKLDAVYIEASVQEIGAHDLLRIAQELRLAHDLAVNDLATAYNDGWSDALKMIQENAPGDSGVVIGWLIHVLQTPSVWQAPEWEGVLELIREARRYLEAGSGE